MIAEAINKLGEGTQTAFIIWVLSRYVLLYLITTLMLVFVVLYVYKSFQIYLKSESFLEEVKEALGTVYLDSDDKKKVIRILKENW